MTTADEDTLVIKTLLDVERPVTSIAYNDFIRGVFNWRAAYSNTNTYYLNDVVSYEENTYIRIDDTPGNELPTNTTFWDAISIGEDKNLTVLASVCASNTVVGAGDLICIQIPGNVAALEDILKFDTWVLRTGGGNGTFVVQVKQPAGGAVIAQTTSINNGNDPARIDTTIILETSGSDANPRLFIDHSNSGNTGTQTNSTTGTFDPTSGWEICLRQTAGTSWTNYGFTLIRYPCGVYRGVTFS